jgi:hypothetical protein
MSKRQFNDELTNESQTKRKCLPSEFHFMLLDCDSQQHILNFLPLTDLFTSRLVNKYLYDSITLNLNNKEQVDLLHMPKWIMSTYLKHVHTVIYNEFNWQIDTITFDSVRTIIVDDIRKLCSYSITCFPNVQNIIVVLYTLLDEDQNRLLKQNFPVLKIIETLVSKYKSIHSESMSSVLFSRKYSCFSRNTLHDMRKLNTGEIIQLNSLFLETRTRVAVKLELLEDVLHRLGTEHPVIIFKWTYFCILNSKHLLELLYKLIDHLERHNKIHIFLLNLVDVACSMKYTHELRKVFETIYYYCINKKSSLIQLKINGYSLIERILVGKLLNDISLCKFLVCHRNEFKVKINWSIGNDNKPKWSDYPFTGDYCKK